jgi:hypothetical protein
VKTEAPKLSMPKVPLNGTRLSAVFCRLCHEALGKHLDLPPKKLLPRGLKRGENLMLPKHVRLWGISTT